jgi:hypothetical protein
VLCDTAGSKFPSFLDNLTVRIFELLTLCVFWSKQLFFDFERNLSVAFLFFWCNLNEESQQLPATTHKTTSNSEQRNPISNFTTSLGPADYNRAATAVVAVPGASSE